MRSRSGSLLLAVVLLSATLAPAVLAMPVAGEPTVTVDHDGEELTVANGSAQVVRGTATAPAGTEILVRVRSTSETTPAFLKTASGVVTENGTWAVAFDFGSQDAGDSFTLTARFENGSAETEVPGEIVACGGDCAGTTPSGTPTPIPEQTTTPTQTDGPAAPVAFGENIFLVDRGGVAAIPIAFEGEGDSTDEAVVVLGDETDLNYELEAVVRDEDGDGQAVLYVDTSLAGRGGDSLSTSGGDAVELHAETDLDSALSPADYDVSLYAGATRGDDPVDVGTLVVQSPTTRTPTAETTAAPTGGTGTAGTGLGSLAIGGLLSGAFIVAGAVLAAVLVKR
ncbi:BGTF surface domain-containing protein [Halobellus ordinarius]|uniref:BGTF surface domain-containing protein n=1 Tax=Halobellus ordinarius TaxID=3075120 RepID=UPI002880BD34|nr:BGTF surface domain-containing protein [Halobellus sp. ZY16]